MRRFSAAILAAGLLALSACAGSQAPPPASSRSHDIALPRDRETIDGRVPRNATLDSLLRQYQIPAEVATALIVAVRAVFDPRALRVNQPYQLTRALDGGFREFRYEIDPGRFLRVATASRGSGVPSFDAAVVPYPREVTVGAASAAITREQPSLIGAFIAAGERVTLALAVADVFGGEIDFNSDLQPGDRVDVLFERVTLNGDSSGYGDISAAVLSNVGHVVTAIRHAGPDGKPGWFDEQGRSLKRQFLRSPLRLDPDPQVTSRFSYHRVNPVSGDVRAHLGVDYHAAAGAPVVAVASGVVISAEWSGDAGRMVELRHAGGYVTAYLHLSAFAPGIRPGARVDQGQLIGRVGASGAVTGPHLDYRVKKNGAYVNPLVELNRMPRGDPIAPDGMAAFAEARDRVLAELRGRASAAAGPAPRRPGR